MERRVLVVRNLFLRPELAQRRAVLHVTPVRQRLQLRDEPSDFLLPVMKSRRGRDDEERAPDVVGLCEIGEQGD